MIVFQKSFLVSGIMCHAGCGFELQDIIETCVEECKQKCVEKNPPPRLPKDARHTVDSEPFGWGIHRLTVSIESDEQGAASADPVSSHLESQLTAAINKHKRLKVITLGEPTPEDKHINWIDIGLNLFAMAAIISLVLIFPPSVLLTLGLTLIAFLITAYTSRRYLIDFFYNIRKRKFTTMATTITLGWLLSLAHTLFHISLMPLASGFSMIFMGFLMPVLLITCINGMDEIKRRIMEKTQKMQLKGIRSLFRQMSSSYRCYRLTFGEMEQLARIMKPQLIKTQEQKNETEKLPPATETLNLLQAILDKTEIHDEPKNLLKEGMLIQVQSGECFPIDCVLIDSHASVDASLLTGEPQQYKRRWQSIPAGAVNLGQPVLVYATNSLMNSTVNSLLFRANRKKEDVDKEPKDKLKKPLKDKIKEPPKDKLPKFAYIYTTLILLAMLASILVPLAFGFITFPLISQNVIGILFSICPCTIAIAHELPKLISLHQRAKKGIHLHNENLLNNRIEKMHTIIVDKTGTLTTAHPEVESSSIPKNSAVWQRLYLLEQTYGQGHPLANAIQTHYETFKKNRSNKKTRSKPRFNDVENYEPNEGNGLSAYVQKKYLHIGNEAYIKNHPKNKDIVLPKADAQKLAQGFSVSYVVEDGKYVGLIYFQHKLRDGVKETLQRLKKNGKTLIMITGDNKASADGLNQQMGSIFTTIHAEQKPQQKEAILEGIMKEENKKESPCPEGVWFIGDGLNDTLGLLIVSEQGGNSCAMNATDKAAFCADISLDGTFRYLSKHDRFNGFIKSNTLQNQGILLYSTLAFLAFVISFSIVGLGVSPLIPMALMVSTTMMVLFNSYRTELNIDVALDKNSSIPKKLLASNLSIGLLLGVSILIIASTIAATIATGGLALPFFAFTAGATLCFSSACTLSAMGLLATFALLFSTNLLLKSVKGLPKDDCNKNATPEPSHETAVGTPSQKLQPEQGYPPLFKKAPPVGSLSKTASHAATPYLGSVPNLH